MTHRVCLVALAFQVCCTAWLNSAPRVGTDCLCIHLVALRLKAKPGMFCPCPIGYATRPIDTFLAVLSPWAKKKLSHGHSQELRHHQRRLVPRGRRRCAIQKGKYKRHLSIKSRLFYVHVSSNMGLSIWESCLSRLIGAACKSCWSKHAAVGSGSPSTPVSIWSARNNAIQIIFLLYCGTSANLPSYDEN